MNAKIRFIFETHFHADFVSGHLTLAKKTGAKIIFGPNANTKFDALIAKDGQEFKIGEIIKGKGIRIFQDNKELKLNRKSYNHFAS